MSLLLLSFCFSALQEIATSMSRGNLEFLRRRGEKELEQSAASLKHSSVVATPIQVHVVGESQNGASLKKVVLADGNNSKFKSEVSTISNINNQETAQSLTDSLTNGSQVQGATSCTSTSVRFDLSGSFFKSSNFTDLSQAHTHSSLTHSLTGRRIISWSKPAVENSFGTRTQTDDDSFVQWVEILSQSFLQYELSTDDLHDIALHCISTLSTSEFTLTLPAHSYGEEVDVDKRKEGAGAHSKQGEEQNGLDTGAAVGYSLADACRVRHGSAALIRRWITQYVPDYHCCL